MKILIVHIVSKMDQTLKGEFLYFFIYLGLQKVIKFYKREYTNKYKLNLFRYHHKNVMALIFNDYSSSNPRKDKIIKKGIFFHIFYTHQI